MGRLRIDDDAHWERCKERIRILYINERRTFREFRDIIDVEFGFRHREHKYQTKLKEWDFRKNLTKSEWAEMNNSLGKQKLDDKQSELILCGQQVDLKRVRRSTKRYGNLKLGINTIRSKKTQGLVDDATIVVRTPPGQPLSALLTYSRPWVQFQESLSHLFDSLQHRQKVRVQTNGRVLRSFLQGRGKVDVIADLNEIRNDGNMTLASSGRGGFNATRSQVCFSDTGNFSFKNSIQLGKRSDEPIQWLENIPDFHVGLSEAPIDIAIRQDDGLYAVQLLIKHGANVNVKERHRNLPLVTAVEQGKYKLVETPLRAGALVNAVHGPSFQCDTALKSATRKGDTDICLLLLQYGANVNPTFIWDDELKGNI